jgi:Cu+-exporting ATPase
VSSIEGCLSKMPGIVSVKVALLAERGIIEYDPAFVGEDGKCWDDARVLEVSFLRLVDSQIVLSLWWLT